MPTIQEIESLTQQYADERARLVERMEVMNAGIAEAKARHMPGIKTQLAEVLSARGALHAAIDESRPLFEKPRTRLIHGIKVGLQKGKGKLVWTNVEKVLSRIKEFYVDEIGVLIQTKETPNKEALARLPAGDLKKLGITVTDTDDAVVIKAVDSEIDKLIEALTDLDEGEVAREDAA